MKHPVYYYLFEKQYGTLGLLKPLAKASRILAMCLLAVYIPAATVAFVSNWCTDTHRYAAILLSANAFTGYDYWAPPLAFLGSYPAWTLYFNRKGLKTDYIFSATYKDFVRVLQDDKYQSMVMVGHGSYNSWVATDREVTNNDIERLANTFTKKSGEWFQLSCGAPDYSDVQLGELVMPKGQVYAYDREVGTLHFIIDALVPFHQIKASTKNRYLSALRHG
jgi:hypothetical protein